MMRAGNSHLVDVTYLEGAGHLLETPYIPHCKESPLYLAHHTDDGTFSALRYKEFHRKNAINGFL